MTNFASSVSTHVHQVNSKEICQTVVAFKVVFRYFVKSVLYSSDFFVTPFYVCPLQRHLVYKAQFKFP